VRALPSPAAPIRSKWVTIVRATEAFGADVVI
jgi:hypothetical protein